MIARRGVTTAALSVTLVLATACSQPRPSALTNPEPTMPPTSATAEFAHKLATDAYGPTFSWPAHDYTIEKLWSTPDSQPRLEAVIDDRSAPAKTRLVAAEVLFVHDFTFLDRHDPVEVARIYAYALTHRTPPSANLWGLLWANGQAGLLGGRFVMLERDAIPALRPLLDDATVVDWYEGSEAATVGNGARYRIKDFAAFYLSRIVGQPIEFHTDFAARDGEIEALRKAL